MNIRFYRSIAFILLIIFTYNSAGYLISFCVQQQLVKNEVRSKIKNGIAADRLKLIKIPLHSDSRNVDFSFEDEEEITFNGQLYDIVKQEVTADSLLLFCLQDAEEAELFEELDENVQSDAAMANKGSNKILKNFIKDYLLTQNEQSLNVSNAKMIFHFRDDLFSSPQLQHFSPPPEV